MGFEEMKNRAKDLLHGHKDEAESGLDKASDLAKEKASGHEEQIEKAEGAIKDKLEDL